MAEPLFIENRIIQPETEAYKEYVKWIQDGKDGRISNGTASFVGQNPYPKMLYMAFKRRDGVVSIADPDDPAFAQKCQKIVGKSFVKDRQEDGFETAFSKAAREEEQAIRQGWFSEPQEAIDFAMTVVERAVSEMAAHREFEDRNLSGNAKAQAQAYIDSVPEQVAEIPRSPVRRGRKPKVQSAPEAS